LEQSNKLAEHLMASGFYWMMWGSYLLGAIFGALLYIEFKLELYSVIPVMIILFILIVADVTANF